MKSRPLALLELEVQVDDFDRVPEPTRMLNSAAPVFSRPFPSAHP
jgi:hypothetical protein